MAYSTEVVRKALQRLESMRADRESEYNAHLLEAYSRVPRLRQIDEDLRKNMARAALAAFSAGEGAGAMEAARRDNEALKRERQTLLQTHFAPGYLDDAPLCDRCGGHGFVGSTMCLCLEELCRQEQQKELALLSGGESFSRFRLDYYPEAPDRTVGVSPRALMTRNLEICRRYAAKFGEAGRNLLFVGGTGLGKTFLSACIAAEVAGKGHFVVYESAPHLFGKLEKSHFKPTEESVREAERFTECELLILDDLGTEMPGSFVTAALYTLVNDRLLAGKSTVISTNLTVEEIAERYSPQIASRLRGEYIGLTFLGEDIRVLKNRGE